MANQRSEKPQKAHQAPAPKIATWNTSFKKLGWYNWDFYVNGVLQGNCKTKQECMSEMTKIAEGKRELKV